jgi:predicted dehydrogenase
MSVGIVGCGNVSGDYFSSSEMHPEIEIIACADVDGEVARAQADQFNVSRVLEPAELIGDPDIELVVNLTPPSVHADITLQAIQAGKHVFTEKPLAPTLETAEAIVRAAGQAGVSIGSAPATFMGGGLQTCRKVIDDGWIGEPVAASAFFTSRGYEHWHPKVDSFYGSGGGPMLDVGPYLISTLLHLLGPASRVAGSTKRFAEERPRPARFPGSPSVPVEVSTHAAGTIDFHGGAVATVITSWELWATKLPYMEIYGTEGTLWVPNPDEFSGTPYLRRGEFGDLAQVPTPPGGGEWREIPMSHRGDVGRAVAIADMALAIRGGRAFRANAEFALHTLEVMLGFDSSSDSGQHVAINSTCERPRPLPVIAPDGSFRLD